MTAGPDRRAVMRGGAVASAAAAIPAAAGAEPAPAEELRTFASIAELAAAAPPAAGTPLFLGERGREGQFVVRDGGPAATDPLQGIAIRGGAGRWFERVWDGVHGRPEWFGARPDDPAADCAPAIEACLAACPVTILGAVDYHVRRTLRLDRSGRDVRGVGTHVTARHRGTRIILSRDATGAATDDVVVLGSVQRPAEGSGGYAAELHVANFTVLREAAPRAHASGAIARDPAGVRVAWITGSSMRGVASLESSVGFYIGGTVYCKLDDCVAFRTVAGAGATDRWTGYYLDGHPSFGFSGGNASIYVNRCIAVGQPAGAVRPTGLRAEGAFVDTFIDNFEAARIDTGIAFHADGARNVGQTVDVHIRGVVLDGCGACGIDIDLDGSSSASIEIVDPYIYAAGGGGEFGIAVRNGAGLTTISGGQVHGDFRGGSLHCSRTRGVRVQGMKIQQSVRPVVVEQADGLRLEPQINNAGKATASFAVECRDVGRSTIAPVVVGTAPGAFGGGVALDARCHHLAIDGSAIDPACLGPSGRAAKVVQAGRDVTAGGAAAFAAARNVLLGVVD